MLPIGTLPQSRTVLRHDRRRRRSGPPPPRRPGSPGTGSTGTKSTGMGNDVQATGTILRTDVPAMTGASGSWSWDPSLYSGSAAYYATGRAAYPPDLADALAAEVGLDGTGRL